MKKMIAVLALSIASATTAMADNTFTCSTAPNKFHGGTTITVTETDAYDAVIQGSQNGGMAHFIREITPVNVKVEHEVDATIYTNSEEGLELTIVTSPLDGKLVTSATFKEGTEFPGLQMTCHNE